MESFKTSLDEALRHGIVFVDLRLDYAFKKTFSHWNAENFAWGRFAFDLSHAF